MTRVPTMTGVRLSFVCLFLIMIQTSSGFFFSFKRGKQSASRPVDQACVAKARRGDCRFYQCFNERHSCGDSITNYAIKSGYAFCSRFDTHKDQMTAQGRRWLNGTRLCAMEKMLDLYRLDALSCADVDSQMRESQAECDAENGLCGSRLLVENKDVFSDVYALNRRSAVQFLETVKKCTLAKFQEASTWFRDQLHSFGDIGQSFLPLFQEVEQRMGQLRNDIQGEFSQLRDTVQQIGRAFGAGNAVTPNSEKILEDDEVD